MTALKIAVVGCLHGELDAVYEQLRNSGVELLLVCGDFQCARNDADLASVAVPHKYRLFHSFPEYYSGRRTAPVLTVFIGGNHEASRFLWQLRYGGWVCPNIYYLGWGGVVTVRGVRIGGLSGIYKPHDFAKPHFERPPLDDSTMRSIYHCREIDILRFLQIQPTPGLDVMLTHDWPGGIAHHGDKARLLQFKPFLRHEIETHTLGNPAATTLLHTLRPSLWFSGHMHVRFEAVVGETKFLALGKCVRGRRDFLQVLDVPVPPRPAEEPPGLCYDAEWLAILRKTFHCQTGSDFRRLFPAAAVTVTDDDRRAVIDAFGPHLLIPTDAIFPSSSANNDFCDDDPQTTRFLTTLSVPPPTFATTTTTTSTTSTSAVADDAAKKRKAEALHENEEKINLDDDD